MRLDQLLAGVSLAAPGRPFMHWGQDATTSYGEAERAVAEQAAELERGGAPGRRVGIMLRNRPELVTLWLGCMRAGATATFLNPDLTQDEVDRIVADLGLVVVFSETDLAPGSNSVAVASTRFPEPLPCPPVPPAGSDAGEMPAAIVLTSGSTGRPKYVQVPHEAYVLKGALNALRLGWSASDRAYCVMPLFHVGAQCETLAPAIAAGASLDFPGAFSASGLWPDLERRGISHLHATGSLLAMALDRGTAPAPAGLRRVVASLREDLVAQLREVLPAVELWTLYGLTECPLGTVGRVEGAFRPGWVGQPYVGGGVRICDAGGRPSPPGQEGEIQFRGAACTWGYVGERDPQPFSEDGWVRTGDLGALQPEGLFLTGRIKEMIRRAGENIAPAEIEEAAARHPAVREAAVVAHPDAIRDEEVRLFVEVDEREGDPTPSELRDFMSRSLARYKLPRYVDIVAELSRTPSNKVDKVALRRDHPQPRWDAEAPPGSP